MKKLSKLIAVLAAMALLMAMSTSVFAVEYLSEGDGDVPSYTKAEELYYNFGSAPAYQQDLDGDPFTSLTHDKVSDEIAADLTDEKVLKEEILKDYVVPDDVKLNVIWAGDLKHGYEKYNEKTGEWEFVEVDLPDGGADITFIVYEEGIEAGDTLYVLHYNEDTKTWDVQEVTVQLSADGESLYFKAHFDSLSPVAVLEALKLDKKTGKWENTKLEGKTSPKTGF